MNLDAKITKSIQKYIKKAHSVLCLKAKALLFFKDINMNFWKHSEQIVACLYVCKEKPFYFLIFPKNIQFPIHLYINIVKNDEFSKCEKSSLSLSNKMILSVVFSCNGDCDINIERTNCMVTLFFVKNGLWLLFFVKKS